MNHDNHAVCVTYFNDVTDNAAKSTFTTWGKFSAQLTEPHPITDRNKLQLPLFNACRYKDAADPTVDNGLHQDGKKVNCFSDTHVRRHHANIIEVSMLILDFDGALPLDAIESKFSQWEYACYTSLNHQVNGIDKCRVVLPTDAPIPAPEYRLLKPNVLQWMKILAKDFEPDSIDESTLSLGQIFILPAVRKECIGNAKSWRNQGKLLNRSDFGVASSIAQPNNDNAAFPRRFPTSQNILNPEDWLETATGSVQVKDIDRKISRVRCPFHADINPGEFAGITNRGTPFIQCKRCGRAYMKRTEHDPIIAGIEKIKEKKALLNMGGEE